MSFYDVSHKKANKLADIRHKDAIEEIINVYDRYKDFSVMRQDEAREYIRRNF